MPRAPRVPPPMLAAATLGLCLAIAGCEAPWSAPSGPTTAGGARLDGEGRLEFWLGAECAAVGKVEVELAESDDGAVLDTWVLRATDPGGATLERLALGIPPDGFEEANALREDWREAEVVRVGVLPAGGPAGDGRFYPDAPARAYVSVETFLDGAGDRDGEWYVQDHGWFTEAEYRALANDDDRVYPYCAVPGQDPATSGT